MGSFNDNIKKKYDSEYLAANTPIHKDMENNRLLNFNFGKLLENTVLKLPGGLMAKNKNVRTDKHIRIAATTVPFLEYLSHFKSPRLYTIDPEFATVNINNKTMFRTLPDTKKKSDIAAPNDIKTAMIPPMDTMASLMCTCGDLLEV